MRDLGLIAGLLAALAIAPSAVAQCGNPVCVAGPTGSPLREATPRFVITTSGFTAGQLPLQLRLEVALSADFAAPLYADTTVTGQSATIVVPRLLPPLVSIWWRVIARTAQGSLVTTNADGPHRTSAWLSLISPNNLNGSTVDTPRPTFLWSAAGLLPPVTPWQFTIVISRKSDGQPVLTGTLTDTVYTPVGDLESNTPYLWAVSAVSGTGDNVREVSHSSVVIASPNAPIATVLFQNFPNPFPTDRLNATCIWFDLKKQADVSLEILDLRGNHVARILPGRGVGVGATLPPGRWGRAAVGSDGGCDPRLTWDGTDDSGRVVRPGVYLIKFSADGVSQIRKALFRGR
jgi:hypothetical protein